MLTSSTRALLSKTAAVLAAGLSIGSLVVVGGTPSAGADPKSATALVGVGSDTTQDVMNALAGFNNGRSYTPIQSSVASGSKQIASWDATPAATCITPKPGPTFDRPNGSTNGRRALSRAIAGTTWGITGSTCGSAKVVGGIVDFARSSAGPASAGTALTYIPLGRDALSFGYYANGVTPVTALTSTQLNTFFSTAGPHVVNGVEIIPCSIQTGSGTYQSWNSTVGVTASQMDSATTTCRTVAGAPGDGTLQENDGVALRARGDLFPGKQVIIGYAAANFISQSNGAAASQLGAGVDLGEIDALGKPYTGAAPNLVPSSSFYSSTKYGRTVYNVFDTAKVTGVGNNDLKTLFVGATSAACSAAAQTTVNAFGFLTPANCGDTSLTGPLVS